MRLFGVTVLLGLSVTLIPVDAMSESFTWNFANDSGQPISIELYSDKRQGHVWPGNGEVWTLPPNGVTYSSPITCQKREKICYGGWLPNDETSYWGVGRGNKQPCTKCCYDCIGHQTQVIRLTGGTLSSAPVPQAPTTPAQDVPLTAETGDVELCNPYEPGPKILRSADVDDLHGDWSGGGGYIGNSWNLIVIGRPQGGFIRGCLESPRAAIESDNSCAEKDSVVVVADEWECRWIKNCPGAGPADPC
jgi:hypothetical protein